MCGGVAAPRRLSRLVANMKTATSPHCLETGVKVCIQWVSVHPRALGAHEGTLDLVVSRERDPFVFSLGPLHRRRYRVDQDGGEVKGAARHHQDVEQLVM